MFQQTVRLAMRYRWLPYVLPFAVYSLISQFEPEPGSVDAGSWYPLIYALKVAGTLLAAIPFWPIYRRIPGGVHPLSGVIGAVAVVLWIGLCRLDWESSALAAVGWDELGARPAFDPFAAFPQEPARLAAFLAIRLVGLSVVVPFMEEIFLRGFLLRFVSESGGSREWWELPIATAAPAAVVAAVCYGVLTHPAEALAAASFFGLVTWWVWRRRSLWDAVAVHATTNLLLGAYVLATRDWSLW